MKTILVIAFFIIVLSAPVVAQEGEWVEWVADAGLSYTAIDNLNLSAFSNDTHSDERLAIDATFGRFYQFNGFTRMSFGLEFDAGKQQTFDLLDNKQLGAAVGLRHKFGLGFYQPYLQFNANYRYNKVEWDANSMDIFFTALEFGQHINNQLSLAASVDYTATSGKAGPVIIPELSSDVFDQGYIHVSVFVDYIISQNWLLSASYARREGEFNSSCSKENVAKVLEVEKVKAITKDDVFGGCVYKLDGSSNIYSTSLSYSLNRHAGINLVMEHYQGKADVLDYSSTSYLLSVNYRY